MIGKHDFEIFPKETAAIYYEEELPVFRGGKPLLNKIDPYFDASGNKGWVSTNKWPLLNAEGRVVGLFGISRDITERIQMEEQIREMAFHDTLTNLPNRRLLTDRLTQAIAASKRSGCYGALMFLDLDNFKPLNDAHGHDAGDLLLIEVAERLKGCVREIDTVARSGGDEFIVILGELDKQEAESNTQAGIVAEKIRGKLSEPYLLTVKREGNADLTVEHHCTASIGVALFGNLETSQDDILNRADSAMYQSKAAGRNLIRFYDARK
jgi:diguanylate cyclase (GGDEF)-like protein